MPLRRQETFRTAMRQNAMEFDQARAQTPPEFRGRGEGLNFHEFCVLVRDREEHEFTDKELRDRFIALDVTGSGMIEKHEYLRFALRDALARSVTRVMEVFEAWDDNEDGEVSVSEFRRAVRALGFADVSDKDIDQVFREYDEDESGCVSRLELERKLKKYAGVLTEQKYKLRRTAGGRKGAALAPSIKLDRESGKPISEQLRDALSSNAVRVMDLFRDWDENQDGLIQKSEFTKAMVPLGIQVSKAEASELFDQFDPDGSGTIEFNELNKLLRRRVDVAAQKRELRHSQSLPGGMRAASILPQPTIPLYAKLPSVASLPRFEGTLGAIAHNKVTDFYPTTFNAAGNMNGTTGSLSASRGGRASSSSLGASAQHGASASSLKGALSHYSTTSVTRPEGMRMSASLPALVASEVARFQYASAVEDAIRRRTTALLVSPQQPTNVFNWPAVQGVPDLDHLAQLWLAPRIGPAWRHQPNQTRVCLPPLKVGIEIGIARAQAQMQVEQREQEQQQADAGAQA